MEFVRNLIKKELQKIEEQLSNSTGNNLSSNISNKDDLKKCLYLIDLAELYNLDAKSIKEIISLPDMKTGYSEYRLIDDCESDEKENWIEVFSDHTKRFLPGDLIIVKK
jgi:hypothetical protein